MSAILETLQARRWKQNREMKRDRFVGALRVLVGVTSPALTPPLQQYTLDSDQLKWATKHMSDSASSEQTTGVLSTDVKIETSVPAVPQTDQATVIGEPSGDNIVIKDTQVIEPSKSATNDESEVVPKSAAKVENEDKGKEPEKVPSKSLSREEKQKLRYDDRSQQVKLENISEQDFYMYRDPMDSVLEESVLLLLKTRDININKTALVELTSLSTNFMDKVFKNLHRLTEIQRRRQPSKRDIRLMLKEGFFDLSGVEDEYSASKKSFKQYSSQIEKIDQLASKLTNGIVNANFDEAISEDDPNYVFFNDLSTIISEIVPPKIVTKPYVPSWLPPFPPEHTYRYTSNFTVQLKTPRVVKERLVHESRLGEKALHHISMLSKNPKSRSESPEVQLQIEDSHIDSDMGDNVNKEVDYIEKREIKWDEIESEPEEEEEVSGPVINHFEVKDEDDPLLQHLLMNSSENKENDEVVEVKKEKEVEKENEKEKSKDNGTKFDIVDFSKRRTAILEKKRKLHELLYQKRINSKEAKLGKHLGFYSRDVKHPDDLSQTINGIFQDEYQQVYSSLKVASIKRQKLLEEQEEARRKAEEERIKNIPAEEYNIEFDMDDNDFDIDMEDVLDNEDFADEIHNDSQNGAGPSEVSPNTLNRDEVESAVKEGGDDQQDHISTAVKQEYVDMDFEEDEPDVKDEEPVPETMNTTVVKEEEITVTGVDGNDDDDDEDDEVDFDFDDVE